MSVEQHKAIVRRFVEEPWNQGNVDTLDELCDPNYTLHGLGGLDKFKAAITNFRTAFPDIQFAIDEMIAEGDKVAYRWTARGTQHGEYQGRPPTGKVTTTTGITIVRFADGKIIEDRFESSRSESEEGHG